MEISTPKQLEQELKKVLDKVLLDVAKEIATIMVNILQKSDVYNSKMETFARYVECTPKKNGEVEIGVNFDKMSDRERGEYDSGWGRYQNTFGENIGSVYWQDNLITFKMAQWLNGDVVPKGNLFGNQPLTKNEWFDKTEKEVNIKINGLYKKYLKKYGLQIEK